MPDEVTQKKLGGRVGQNYKTLNSVHNSVRSITLIIIIILS